jgi:addiction module RelE/StbE family toxin
MKVRYTRRAIEDLAAIFAYIRKENPLAASRVVDRIEYVVQELGHNPGMGVEIRKRGIRRFPITGTPYLIFYEVLGGEIPSPTSVTVRAVLAKAALRRH